MKYKKTILILGTIFILASLYAFYSLYINDGSVVINVISDSREIPILMLKAILAGVFISGIVHAVIFIINFAKKNHGNKGITLVVLAIIFSPLTVIIGMITVIPYMIYCLIETVTSH